MRFDLSGGLLGSLVRRQWPAGAVPAPLSCGIDDGVGGRHADLELACEVGEHWPTACSSTILALSLAVVFVGRLGI